MQPSLLGRGLNEQTVAVGLIAAEPIAQAGRYGDADVVVGARQQLGLAGLEPLLALARVAGGTTAIAAAVVDMEVFATVPALVEMPAHGLRATGRDVLDGAAVPRQHPLTKGIEIRRPELAEYVRNFDGSHDRTAASIEQGHAEARSGVVELLARRFGKMQIGLGRPDAGVTQQDADRLGGYALFNKACGERMAIMPSSALYHVL